MKLPTQLLGEVYHRSHTHHVLLLAFVLSKGWDDRDSRKELGGAGGIRTPDLLDAIEARCQLRYGPTAEFEFSIGEGRGQTGRDQ